VVHSRPNKHWELGSLSSRGKGKERDGNSKFNTAGGDSVEVEGDPQRCVGEEREQTTQPRRRNTRKRGSIHPSKRGAKKGQVPACKDLPRRHEL